MGIKIIASCNCGAIQFKSTENPILQVCCHCTDCRKATKNDFSNIVFFKGKFVSVIGKLTGHEYIAESQNKTSRESCLNCGDIMFDKSEGFPGLIGVFEPRLKMPFVAQTNCHVWVKSKLPHIMVPATSKQYVKGII